MPLETGMLAGLLSPLIGMVLSFGGVSHFATEGIVACSLSCGQLGAVCIPRALGVGGATFISLRPHLSTEKGPGGCNSGFFKAGMSVYSCFRESGVLLVGGP